MNINDASPSPPNTRFTACAPVRPIRRIGGSILDVRRREVFAAEGLAVHLTATEFDLLQALTVEPGVVRTRADLVTSSC